MAELHFDLRTEMLIPFLIFRIVAFGEKSPVNQNSLVQLWGRYPQTRDLGLIRPWVNISEGGPEILKDGVP